MRDVTLCFLRKDNHICLAMKKRGFGVGKLNGVGGKVENTETIEDAAVREIEEEIGVQVRKKHLQKIGTLQFSFENKDDWGQLCHVYFVEIWRGEPVETEEMAPSWHHKNEIPFSDMWVDDPLWLPQALEYKKIEATFHFNEDGSNILKYKVQ